MKKIKILIDEKGQNIKEYSSFTIKVAKKVLEAIYTEFPCEHSKCSELSILLVDDSTMRHLNNIHRGVDSPTDVLAFPLLDGFQMSGPPNDSIPRLLGDIVISIDTARIQADLYTHSIEEEISLLVIHGILHLLGYSDESTEERRKMEKFSKKILDKIDIHRLIGSICKGGKTKFK